MSAPAAAEQFPRLHSTSQEPIPLLGDAEDTSDLTSAIAKLNSGSILHTEKRAIGGLVLWAGFGVCPYTYILGSSVAYG